jgi:hypothetical protein
LHEFGGKRISDGDGVREDPRLWHVETEQSPAGGIPLHDREAHAATDRPPLAGTPLGRVGNERAQRPASASAEKFNEMRTRQIDSLQQALQFSRHSEKILGGGAESRARLST